MTNAVDICNHKGKGTNSEIISPIIEHKPTRIRILALLTCQLLLGAIKRPIAIAVISGNIISRSPSSSASPTIIATIRTVKMPDIIFLKFIFLHTFILTIVDIAIKVNKKCLIISGCFLQFLFSAYNLSIKYLQNKKEFCTIFKKPLNKSLGKLFADLVCIFFRRLTQKNPSYAVHYCGLFVKSD